MKSKKINIIIEKSKDHFGAYAENVEGIYGGGDTVEEVKKDIGFAIETLKEIRKEKDLPDILKGDYEITYQFDTESLLKYYKGIFTYAALERMTGINRKQMQHYSSGLRKPRPQTRRKIENSLHKLGEELLAIEL